MIEGVRELLLRGNFGRFSPSPLIRSALEVIIARTVLNTKYSNKYNSKAVYLQNDFSLHDILNAADKLANPFQFGTNHIRGIYNWGSISTHRANSPQHCEMWYSLRFIEHESISYE